MKSVCASTVREPVKLLLFLKTSLALKSPFPKGCLLLTQLGQPQDVKIASKPYAWIVNSKLSSNFILVIRQMHAWPHGTGGNRICSSPKCSPSSKKMVYHCSSAFKEHLFNSSTFYNVRENPLK